MPLPAWLDDLGWQRRPRGDNGVYTGGPARFVLHTTEGGLAGSIAALDRNNAWPQLLIDPWQHVKLQAYPLTMPGRSLADRAGGVTTNRHGAVQVEIVGRAAESPGWPDAVYEYLGRELGAVIRRCGIASTAPTFVGPEAGTIASPNAPQRMSYATWNAFNGVCGHQHVPENDHWNPGRFDWQRFVSAAGGALTPAPVPAPTLKELTMQAIYSQGYWRCFYVPQSGEYAGALVQFYWNGSDRGRQLLFPPGYCAIGPATMVTVAQGPFESFIVHALAGGAQPGRHVHTFAWDGAHAHKTHDDIGAIAV